LEVAPRVKSSRVPHADAAYLARCITCGVTKRFFTAQGVSGFRFEHSDHDVKVEGLQEPAEASIDKERVEPNPQKYAGKTEDGSGADAPSVVDLQKLDVRVLTSEIDDSIHFEVIGYAPDDGFSFDVPLTKARELRDFVKAGSHSVTRGRQTQEFRWTEARVRADGQVCGLLGIHLQEVEVTERVEPKAAATEQKPEPELETTEQAAPVAAQEPPAAKKQEAVVKVVHEEERESLLVANSFYMKDGEEVGKEALRVSRALKELRWGVKPPYLISVIIDDNVGIEANSDAIMADLVEKIESIGYKFVAVNAPNSKPTAWFKRKNAEPPAETESDGKLSDSVKSMTRAMEVLVKQLESERVETTKMARDAAAQEEMSSSLSRQMQEMAPSAELKEEEARKD
jgi:hypothetical protein